MVAYKVIRVDLTERRSKFRLVFSDSITYSKIIFTRVDDTCYVKLDDDSNDDFQPYQGLKVETSFRAIYVSNPASSVSNATLEIIVLF